jgi:hypothetical protein
MVMLSPGVLVEGGKEGYVKKGGGVPKFLRTKKGDLPFSGPGDNGPNCSRENGNLLEAEGVLLGQEEVVGVCGGVVGNVCLNKVTCNQMAPSVSRPGPIATSKKHSNRRNFPNLPYNMLRKLPGPFNGVKRNKHKKDCHREGGRRRSEEEEGGSDSIQNSSSEEGQHDVLSAVEASGVGLEIVLPFDQEVVGSVGGVTGAGTSGIIHLVEGGGFPVEDDGSGGRDEPQRDEDSPPSREVYEARNLVAINEELGVKFLNNVGEEVDRMVQMEVRDREAMLVRERDNGF